MEYLLVGLGNPGPRYKLTRHNAGFIFLDYLAHGLDLTFKVRDTLQAEYVQGTFAGAKIHLLKPLTYMNLSGRSVAAFLKNSNIKIEDVCVAHDEVDIAHGELRIKKGGGDAGHNGLKSIRQECGSGEFYRFRLGVGRPTHASQDLADFVLEAFSKAEQEPFAALLQKAEDCFEVFCKEGLQKAQEKAAAP